MECKKTKAKLVKTGAFENNLVLLHGTKCAEEERSGVQRLMAAFSEDVLSRILRELDVRTLARAGLVCATWRAQVCAHSGSRSVGDG